MTWGTPNLLDDTTGSTAATSRTLTGITAPAGTLVVVGLAFIASSSSVSGFAVSDSTGVNAWTSHALEQTNGGPGYLGFAWSVLTSSLSSGSITMTRTGSGNITRWA